MSNVTVGQDAPEFVLKQGDGSDFTNENLQGQRTLFVVYPFAFSPVCSDQLQVYQELAGELADLNVQMYGVSTDPSWSQTAFIEKLGIDTPQLSDFEPKGAAATALDVYFPPAGMTNRALILFDEQGKVVWHYVAETPGELPGVGKVREGLAVFAA